MATRLAAAQTLLQLLLEVVLLLLVQPRLLVARARASTVTALQGGCM